MTIQNVPPAQDSPIESLPPQSSSLKLLSPESTVTEDKGSPASRALVVGQPIDGLMKRPWVLGSVIFTLLALVFALGISFGYGWGRSGVQAAEPSSAALRGDGAQGMLYPAFELYWEAMDLLYRDFDGTLPAPEEATYAAIRGVIETLGDPNTAFLTPEDAEFFRSNMEGTFEGIGARVAWDEDADTLLISEAFENQPAWTAGLRRNDLILAVDGESLVGTDLSESVRRIRGPKGTELSLTVQRGEDLPYEVRVMRDRIAVPTIATDSLGENGEIAYVRLNAFNENAGSLVREAVRNALSHDPQGIIFDLRGNSGGLLREAVKVASVFMEDEVVLLERFNDGRIETYRTTGSALTTDLPMIVLVNEGSASASEIVAGALQDVGRATLIGTTTYGKGSVQLPHNLSNGGIMRVTIARWYTPKDRTIDGTGLAPDEVVEISEEEITAGADPQLDAALERLISPSSVVVPALTD